MRQVQVPPWHPTILNRTVIEKDVASIYGMRRSSDGTRDDKMVRSQSALVGPSVRGQILPNKFWGFRVATLHDAPVLSPSSPFSQSILVLPVAS